MQTYARKTIGTFSDARNRVEKNFNAEQERMAEEAIGPVFEFLKWFTINVVLPIVAITDDKKDDKELIGRDLRNHHLAKRSFCYWLYDARKEFQTAAFQEALKEAMLPCYASGGEDSLSSGGRAEHSFSCTN